MVKTRLTKWGLHKKLQLPEMRTALQILGPDRSQWPSPAPQFRIHGRVVDLDTILRSYGRKGIREPFEWIRLTSDSDYERSSNVELISDSTPADSERELDEIGQLFELSTPATPKASAPTVSACVTRDWRCYPGVPSIVAQELRDPDIYLHSTTAIRHVQAYCLSYMTSARSQFHNEPEIHHLTSHARFLDRMDEGIVLFGREQMGMAFATFDKGFELLKEMFMDIHPMAVATYLLLLCKLTVHKITPVLVELLRHTHELARALKAVPHSLAELFRTISKCTDILELPLLCIRAASDVLEAKATTDWKTLYVRERQCDALYHAQVYGELATKRAQLLKFQEARYGPCARNVLWTSLNVADDHLIHGQLDEAQARFARVVHQSDQHSGYHRAKSRVVALEGLAKVSFLKASKQVNTYSTSTGLPLIDSTLLLQQALEFISEALQLAQVWFENGGRRIGRLRDFEDSIRATLASL